MKLTTEECHKLVENDVLDYMDKELLINNPDYFSFEIPMYGTRRDSKGRCWNAKAFRFEGKYYPDNYIVNRIKGRISKTDMVFNPSENMLQIEGELVHMNRLSYEGDLSTYLWKEKKIECLQTIEEVYNGPARLYIPTRKNQNIQILVNDNYSGIIFGLDVSKPRKVCGSELYRTQLSNMFVTWKKRNFVKNIERTMYVDRLDNVIGR